MEMSDEYNNMERRGAGFDPRRSRADVISRWLAKVYRFGDGTTRPVTEAVWGWASGGRDCYLLYDQPLRATDPAHKIKIQQKTAQSCAKNAESDHFRW